MSFINYSIFPAISFKGTNNHKSEFHIVTARVTYDIKIMTSDGKSILTVAPEQAPLNYSDVHFDDDIKKSIRYESDLSPYKPKTDVIINATAFSPGNRATAAFDVGVQLGKYIKPLRIHGPRYWIHDSFGWELSPAEPVKSLDIRYEYATGGTLNIHDKIFASPANPSGMGWYPKEYLKQCGEIILPGPQIESPEAPITHISQPVRPDGFGFFGRSWQDRIKYAGTYDDNWLEKQHPFPPVDFKFNYWCGAHPSLQIPHIEVGNKLPVKLFGLIPSSEIAVQKISFYIPTETLFIFIVSELGISVTKDMQLDTIVIDMAIRKVFCTYRITVPESVKAAEIQLRYISEDNMKSLSKTPGKQCPDKTEFIPVPPSLVKKGIYYG
ncbi:MAG: DUF2169 domain-containing protein [Morganella sp. (in: enterobacteria)]